MNSNNSLRSRSQEEGEIGEEEGEISSVPRRTSTFRPRLSFSDRPPDRGFRRNSSGGGGRGGRGGIAGGGRGGVNNSNWLPRRGGRGGRGNSFNRSESSNFSRSEGAPFHRNASISTNTSGDFSSQGNPQSSGGNRPTDPRSSNTAVPGNPNLGDPRRDLESRTFRGNNQFHRRNSNFSRNNNYQSNAAASSVSSNSDSSGIFRNSNNNSGSSNFGRSFSNGNEETGGDFVRSSSRSENDFRSGEFRKTNFRSARSDVEFRSGDFQNSQSRSSDDFRPASSSAQETDSFPRSNFQPNQSSQQQKRLSSYSSLADTRPGPDFSSAGHSGFRQSPTQRRKSFQFQQSSSNSNSKNMQDINLPIRNSSDIGASPSDSSRILTEAGEVRNSMQESSIDQNTSNSRSTGLDNRRSTDSRGYENQRQMHQRTPPQRWDPRFPRPQSQTQQISQSHQASSLSNIDIPEEEEQARESPLTVSVLGEANIEKAASTIKKIGEIMNEPSFVSNVTGQTRLPDKKLMDSAMQKQDGLIKKATDDVKKAEMELKKIQEEEDEKLKLQKKAALEKRKRQDKEKRRVEEERLQQQREAKEKEMQLKLEECRNAWEERMSDFEERIKVEKEKILSDLQQKIEEERNSLEKGYDSKVAIHREDALESFDQNIDKIKRQIQKNTKEENQANAEVLQLESEFHSTLRNTSNNHVRHDLYAEVSVNAILADNRRKAKNSQKDSLFFIPDQTTSDSNLVHGKTIDEWSRMARRVTGRADALYTEPSENPLFERNQSMHQQIAPLVKEYIRDNQRKLKQRWAELAEEYVVRKQLYDKKLRRRGSTRESISGNSKRGKGRASILGMNNQAVSSPSPETPSTPGGGRTSGRRARRGGTATPGDVVRSEYEQEQIIAELTAKEALEKRIAHGGIRPPRQICKVENMSTAAFINTFESHKTLDPVKESQEQSRSNIWTDMEKCIFLDRFLQHPKDFRKIASFLRNKSTKDCVAFYYHSKQSVPYKVALKEHLMRRKRRGDYQNWDATIESSISCGAIVSAGTSEEKPLIFKLPAEDTTYYTFDLHPIRNKILDKVDASGDDYSEKEIEEHRANKRRKRKRDPLFVLEEKARKYLRNTVYDAQPKAGNDEIKSALSRDKFEVADRNTNKKLSNKWTASEKKIFHEIVREHGTNWSMLGEMLPTKTPGQIRSFYNEQKKQGGKKHSGTIVEDSRAGRIESEIPRKKTASVEIERNVGDKDVVIRDYTGKSRRQSQKTQPEQIQQEIRPTEQKTSNASDFHQQAFLELAAHKAAQEQAKLQTEQQNSKHEAVLLMHQQQNHLLKQQAAQEEARRLLQSQLGLSGLAPWATQLAALQHQQQQSQHQHSSSQQNDAVREYAHSFQNAMALRQGTTTHHGFSLDPSVHRSVGLSRLQGLNRGIGNSPLLQHPESNSQRSEAERALVGLRNSDATSADTLNVIRAAAGLSRAAAPTSIAGALALLNHAVNHGEERFCQDQHRSDHQNRGGY